MLHVFIGWDPSESIAAQVMAHSIARRASGPVAITFLRLSQLASVHKRERHPLQSTEFSFTRFLSPYLTGYRGHCVFFDCDMLVLDDVYKLLNATSALYAPVSVVKHEHKPTAKTKMLGQVQTTYEMKNWSSVMLFWGGHSDTHNLTPEYVDRASGLELHQFKWVNSRHIGRLPHRWNHLVGWDDDTTPADQLSCIHWTEGGPWWEAYEDAPYADLWRAERADMEQAYERARSAA